MAGKPQIAVLACVCAALLAGCGSEDEGTIPPDDSDRLLSLLDGIEDNVAGGNCEIAQKQADEFIDAVNLLPAEVDDEVKGGLREAGAQLTELSDDPSQCEETTGETGVGGIETTTEPTTTTTPPPTTETTTTETEEEKDKPDQEEEEPAPASDQGEGGPDSGPGGGPPGGGPPEGAGEGEVTIGPGSDEPTSGGIGGERKPRR